MIKQEKAYIYGRHAVMEALENTPEIIEKLYVDLAPDRELSSLIMKHNIRMERFTSSPRPAREPPAPPGRLD